MGWIIENDITQ